MAIEPKGPGNFQKDILKKPEIFQGLSPRAPGDSQETQDSPSITDGRIFSDPRTPQFGGMNEALTRVFGNGRMDVGGDASGSETSEAEKRKEEDARFAMYVADLAYDASEALWEAQQWEEEAQRLELESKLDLGDLENLALDELAGAQRSEINTAALDEMAAPLLQQLGDKQVLRIGDVEGLNASGNYLDKQVVFGNSQNGYFVVRSDGTKVPVTDQGAIDAINRQIESGKLSGSDASVKDAAEGLDQVYRSGKAQAERQIAHTQNIDGLKEKIGVCETRLAAVKEYKQDVESLKADWESVRERQKNGEKISKDEIQELIDRRDALREQKEILQPGNNPHHKKTLVASSENAVEQKPQIFGGQGVSQEIDGVDPNLRVVAPRGTSVASNVTFEGDEPEQVSAMASSFENAAGPVAAFEPTTLQPGLVPGQSPNSNALKPEFRSV